MRLAEYEKIKVNLDKKDIAFLSQNHSKHLAIKIISENEVELKANCHVGKIVLPSKMEIDIKPKIKINNLLYMISYTYSLVNFSYSDKIMHSKNNALIDIYVIVLLNWIESLFKKGLFKNYQDFTQELTAIKGKILINESLTKRNKLVCEFHDISFSNEENRIIKATLLFIINKKGINEEERQKALIFYRMLKDVSKIQLTKSIFKSLNIFRLNSHYKPIIELCEIIYNNLRLTDERGEVLFSGYMINLNLIFEKFLLKALQKRMKREKVDSSKKSNWAKSNDNFLPQIQPDIYVHNKAIIDAKYYKSPLTNNNKFISGHIYQIITYLKAYKISNGFLIYPEPETGKEFDSKYCLDDLCFNVVSIPLNKEIKDIENKLDSLVSQILSPVSVN